MDTKTVGGAAPEPLSLKLSSRWGGSLLTLSTGYTSWTDLMLIPIGITSNMADAPPHCQQIGPFCPAAPGPY